MNNRFLIVIVGPTAIGKTDLSINLAKKLETEIISSDSRQFYKELEIGTAKPSAKELKEIKHHFINNLSILDDYSVGQYEKEAIELIENLFEKKETLILTGGSGLFVKAITNGFDDLPDINPEIRNNLNEILENEGLSVLQERLINLDIDAPKYVDLKNTQRVLRSLEVLIQTNKPIRYFQNGNQKNRPFKIIKIGLEMPREELYARIDKRMDQMLQNGLMEEVKNLINHKEKNALQTVGYKEVFGYLNNEYDYEYMVHLLKRNSRRYAKRQLTWFKNQDEYKWFHPANFEEIYSYIKLSLI